MIRRGRFFLVSLSLAMSLLAAWLPAGTPVAVAEEWAQPSGQARTSGQSAGPDRRLELLGQIGGAAHAVALQGKYAYLGVGPRLVFLDVTNPSQPVLLGQSVPLPEAILGIAVVGMYAYVADGFAGVRVLNVANPARPAEATAYATGGRASAIIQVQTSRRCRSRPTVSSASADCALWTSPARILPERWPSYTREPRRCASSSKAAWPIWPRARSGGGGLVR